MAAITICSDFGAPQNKVWHCFHCFPIYLPSPQIFFKECTLFDLWGCLVWDVKQPSHGSETCPVISRAQVWLKKHCCLPTWIRCKLTYWIKELPIQLTQIYFRNEQQSTPWYIRIVYSQLTGLFSSILREQANLRHDGPKWIVLDGDIDPMWIESLNTVMDDNKVNWNTVYHKMQVWDLYTCMSFNRTI